MVTHAPTTNVTLAGTSTAITTRLPSSIVHGMRARAIQRGPKAAEDVERYLARFAVVKICPLCGEPLIAEELEAHADEHLSDEARTWVRTLRQMVSSPAVRVEVLQAFCQECGRMTVLEPCPEHGAKKRTR